MRLGSAFTRVWVASTGSNLGDGVIVAAMPLLATTYTRDPLLIGGLTVAAGLPWLLFSLVAGALVDRLDRRHVMVVADIARTVLVGLLGLAVLQGWDSLALVYVVVLLLGVGETLFDTAAQTILPAVVGPEHLERANGSLFAAQITTNQFLGPPLGGFLFALAVPSPLFLDAVTFLTSSALLATVRGRFVARQRTSGTTLLQDIREGLSFLWRTPLIRAMALGAATINFASAGTAALFVLFATEILHLGPVGYGTLLTLGAVGSVAGSLCSARITARIGKGTALWLSVAAIAVSLAGIGLATSVVMAGAAFALFGFASDVWNVIAVSYRQRVVPDRLLGRLNAAYRLLAYGALPLGALFAGAVARWADLRTPYLIGSAAVVVLTAVFVRLRSAVDAGGRG